MGFGTDNNAPWYEILVETYETTASLNKRNRRLQ